MAIVPRMSMKSFLSYSNIRYERLDKDPGIYGCWNYMIENSESKYITNANVDDKLFAQSIERHVNILERFPTFDVSYCLNIVSHSHSETPESISGQRNTFPTAGFSKNNMLQMNLPHNHPVWRRSIHNDCGMFDNENYVSGSDYDFWLRACIEFNKKFILIPETLGVYYENPEGMSTKKSNMDRNMKEVVSIKSKYSEKYLSV